MPWGYKDNCLIPNHVYFEKSSILGKNRQSCGIHLRITASVGEQREYRIISTKHHHCFDSYEAILASMVHFLAQDEWWRVHPSLPWASIAGWLDSVSSGRELTMTDQKFSETKSVRRGRRLSHVFVSLLPHPLPCPPVRKLRTRRSVKTQPASCQCPTLS